MCSIGYANLAAYVANVFSAHPTHRQTIPIYHWPLCIDRLVVQSVNCGSKSVNLSSRSVSSSLIFLFLFQLPSNTCGNSQWKAASVEGKKFAKKAQTGCMLATCRHAFVLKALDMERGEMFVYPYILQVST